MMSVWQPLHEELKRWEGRTAVFWLRDDDAIEPTAALERLLQFPVPLLLAVIPKPTGIELAERLVDESRVSVAVHGWSHTNHAPVTEKKQEFGPHRPMAQISEEAMAGWEKLSSHFGPQFSGVFVPPWNRIDASVVPVLGKLGYRAISTFGKQTYPGLPVVNSTVDIMDWRGTRGGREHSELVEEIVAQLAEARETGAAIGILAHHLAHDETAWRFLEGLISETAGHEQVRWSAIDDLL